MFIERGSGSKIAIRTSLKQLLKGPWAPRISGDFVDRWPKKRAVRSVYIPQASQMFNLCGSYFNCERAEDSNVCFVNRRMSNVAWSKNDER